MKQWLYDNRYGLIVALVAAIILLPFLGAVPLMDPDEPVYGETAREMLACRRLAIAAHFLAISGMTNRLSFTGWK